ncbi:MAG: hypothetical protein HY920_03020, partial [Elusimicrobia bacterium]|nr:hypothetical protein [Elusimicrobiota bacterium]
MKKVLVLVVAMLALAGMATLAYADVIIFQDSQVYPFANWQGSNQDNYGTSTQPNRHSLSDWVVMSPFIGAPTDPDLVGNYVIKLDYDMSTLVYPAANEAWSGHLMRASPKVSLVGVTQFSCKVRADLATTGSPVIDKIVTSDSNDGLINISTGFSIGSATWTTVSSSAGAFTGRNMSAVPTPFGLYMVASANSGVSNTGSPNHVIIYVDDIKFTGGSSGAVRVTMTTGVVGVQVDNTINFDLLAPLAANTSYNSARIGNTIPPYAPNVNNHFDVTNIGSEAADYDLSLVNPGGWTAVNPNSAADALSWSLGTDQYAIWGVFTSTDTTTGPSGEANYGSEDVITTALTLSTNVIPYVYSDGSVATETGVNVPKNRIRRLWIALHTPPLSTVANTQQITIA